MLGKNEAEHELAQVSGVPAPAPRALPLEVRASFQQLSLGRGGMCLSRPVPSLSCATTTPAPCLLHSVVHGRKLQGAQRHEGHPVTRQRGGWGLFNCLLSTSLPLPRLWLPLVSREVSIPSDSACAVRLWGREWGGGRASPRLPHTRPGPARSGDSSTDRPSLSSPSARWKSSCGSVGDTASEAAEPRPCHPACRSALPCSNSTPGSGVEAESLLPRDD